jgi:hypothetical protein
MYKKNFECQHAMYKRIREENTNLWKINSWGIGAKKFPVTLFLYRRSYLTQDLQEYIPNELTQ